MREDGVDGVGSPDECMWEKDRWKCGWGNSGRRHGCIEAGYVPLLVYTGNYMPAYQTHCILVFD